MSIDFSSTRFPCKIYKKKKKEMMSMMKVSFLICSHFITDRKWQLIFLNFHTDSTSLNIEFVFKNLQLGSVATLFKYTCIFTFKLIYCNSLYPLKSNVN